MNRKQSKTESKIQGVPKRANLYARVSKYAPKAIKRLAELLDSKNESVALGAAKVILEKVLPDLKAVEAVDKENQEPLQIIIVEDNENNTAYS